MLHTRDDRRSKFVNIIYCISRFQHGKVQILQYRAHELSSGGRGRKKGRQEGHGIFGGMVVQEGEATHVKGTCFCFFFCFFAGYGDAAFEKTESETRVYVYMYMYIIIIFFTYNIYISLYRFFLLFCLRFIFLPLFLSLSFSHSRSFSLSSHTLFLSLSLFLSSFLLLLSFSRRQDADECHGKAPRRPSVFAFFSHFFLFFYFFAWIKGKFPLPYGLPNSTVSSKTIHVVLFIFVL